MNNKTIAEFLEHHKQFCQFRPASREEAGLFYSEPNQTLDEALGTVGHLRMDFGSGGKEFSIPGGHITKTNSTLGNLRMTFRMLWMPFVPMAL